MEIKKPLKPKPTKKFKIEETKPADIVDVWTLYKQSLAVVQNYPDVSEEPDAYIRSQLFSMICDPTFLGVIAKVGRKPVGQLNGFVTHRPYGKPRDYFQFWMFWIDPEYRGAELSKQMFKTVCKRLKEVGIFNFESIIDPAMIPAMEKVYGGQLAVVSHRIIGKVKAD